MSRTGPRLTRAAAGAGLAGIALTGGTDAAIVHDAVRASPEGVASWSASRWS